jgi:hypothetical protein
VMGMAPAVAVKVAEVAAAGTVIEATTGSKLLVLESETVVPPLGAAPLSVTVQVVLPELVIVEGAQDSELRDGAVAAPVTVPPVTASAMVLPAGEDAAVLVIAIDVLVTPAAIVKFTTATVPFGIMVGFRP